MASTTLGVKVDDLLRSRLKDAAARLERTPHWLIKQAIFAYLEKIEHGQLPAELSGTRGATEFTDGAATASDEDSASHPFLEFAQSVQPQSVLRAAITAAYRRPEPECVPFLLGQARVPANLAGDVETLASKLVDTLRGKRSGGGVEGLIHEFSLSSQEGVALMCLAEALLRIPDRATRDALIRDKISKGDWKSHVGHAPSLFVNAATWGFDDHRQARHDEQRDRLVVGADADDRQGRRTADSQGRRHGDAPDGRAVRHRRKHL